MIPWGKVHTREALRRTYEIAAELVATDPETAARLGRVCAAPMAEGAWRAFLEGAPTRGAPRLGLDRARIVREVRRVRALAEGRLVRETERLVLWPDGCKRPIVGDVPFPKGWPVLRVTRIHRCPR